MTKKGPTGRAKDDAMREAKGKGQGTEKRRKSTPNN